MPTELQLELPLARSPRVRHGRIVAPQPETDEIYHAVLQLRRAGRTVHRAGAGHRVDGRHLSTRQLLALAAASR